MIDKTINTKLFDFLISIKRWKFFIFLFAMTITPFLTGKDGYIGVLFVYITIYYAVAFVVHNEIFKRFAYVSLRRYTRIKFQILVSYIVILLGAISFIVTSGNKYKILIWGVDLDILLNILGFLFLFPSIYYINPMVISKGLNTYFSGRQIKFNNYYKDFFRILFLSTIGVWFVIYRIRNEGRQLK